MIYLTHLWSGFLLPAIDILLIAFVFYRLLILIRGTQSVPVVMGLAVLMGITVMLRYFLPLPASLWLLDNFWRSAVLLLAVVFQPEFCPVRYPVAIDDLALPRAQDPVCLRFIRPLQHRVLPRPLVPTGPLPP